MIESAFIQDVVDIGLVIMVGLMIACTFRVLVGPTPADRLQAVDTMTNVLIGIIVLLSLVQDAPFLVDLGLALAAFGFVASLAIARFVGEGRVF